MKKEGIECLDGELLLVKLQKASCEGLHGKVGGAHPRHILKRSASVAERHVALKQFQNRVFSPLKAIRRSPAGCTVKFMRSETEYMQS